MRPCSEQETCVEEVLVWPEVAPLSTEPEAKEADPVDKWKRKASCLDCKHEKKRAKSFMSAEYFKAVDMSLRVVESARVEPGGSTQTRRKGLAPSPTS